jgi:hypothetical protein
MNPLIASLQLTARRPLMLLLVLAALLTWIAAFFLWLGIPVATAWQVALQALSAAALVAFPVLLVVRLFRALGGAGLRFSLLLALALCIAAVVGLYAPYKLIWWIPQVKSMTAQTVSMVVRFLVAGLLASFSLVWVIGIAAQHGKELSSRQQ